MTPDRWQQVCEVFNAALEVPIDDRSGFLAAACDADQELQAEVTSLLASHHRAEPFFPDLGANDSLLPGVERPVAERIGPYRVEKRLGEGGMGTVFLAVRADREFEKQVAIKVMRADLVDAELVSRFRGERQSSLS